MKKRVFIFFKNSYYSKLVDQKMLFLLKILKSSFLLNLKMSYKHIMFLFNYKTFLKKLSY